MLNQVTLIGRLGKNPELRFTQSGKAVANFTIATSEGKDQTEWHNIVVWEKQAENCSKFLQRGSLACVSGRIASRKYADKQGVERLQYEIVAHSVRFLSPKAEGSTAPSSGANSSLPPLPTDFDNFGSGLEDIPF